jgi:(p)ppGpp synthase/HD superfamily hydrolase
MTNLEKALLVAEKAHNNQSYDIFPYVYHVKQVVRISREFYKDDEVVQVACALHDTLEDTSLSYSDLKKTFGETVAEIVYNVTDELGRTRKERKEKTYPKIKSDWKSVAVKLCDRIANVEHSKEFNQDMFNMYKKERASFCAELYSSDGLNGDAWEHLDRLFI